MNPRNAGPAGEVPLTVFDRQVLRIYTRRIFMFPRGLDAGRLAETLPLALDAYALLAGRLHRRATGPVIDTTPRGARLDIVDHAAATPRRLAPAAAPRMIDSLVAAPGRAAPLMTMQINRMSDGGAILGFANNHGLMDGPSCYQFLEHWAALARGDAELRPPCHRRRELEALCRRSPAVEPAALGLRRASVRDLAGMATYVFGARLLLERVLLEFDGARLATLKSRARAELPVGSTAEISSNDALTAHLWRVLEGLGEGSGRPLAMITNARGAAGELGGKDYFGNYNDLALVPVPTEHTLGARAAALRTVGASWSGARTLARGRVLQERERRGPRLAPAGVLDTVHGALLINNWSRFPIFQLDFGTGRPCWFDIPLVPLRRMVIVTAHPTDPGGRLVHMTLTRADRRALESPAAQRQLHA